MKINPINNRYSAPGFGTNRRIIKDSQGKLMYRTTTYFYRCGLDWQSFTNYILHKYKNTPKVNVINHVCSNGPEPYTLAMQLINKCGEKAEKFFPILAKDINKENIENAKNNSPIGMSDADVYLANHYTKNKFFEYFTPVLPTDNEDDFAVQAKDNIRDKVKFSLGDIFQDIDDIPSSDTILLCRNFWPYLDDARRRLLIQKMQKFDNTSLVVIGEYDTERSNIEQLLLENDFIQTHINYVYTREKPIKPVYRKAVRILHNLCSNNNKLEQK